MPFVTSAGLLSPVGAHWRASCSAIRARIQGFAESAFFDGSGKPITVASAWEAVPGRCGVSLLAEMAASVIDEALAGDSPKNSPLLCALPRADRPGRSAHLETEILPQIQSLLGTNLHHESRFFPYGEVGGLKAIRTARELMRAGRAERCLICGVDSLINATTLRFLEQTGRLKGESNPDGLIPGEGAACVMIAREGGNNDLHIRGTGFGKEDSVMGGDEPVLGLGLSIAMKAALTDANMTMDEVDYRLTDATGERYWFSDAAFGMARVLRVRKRYFEMWNVSDSIGHTGATAGVAMLAYLLYVFQNGLSPHRGVMLHNSCASGERAAAIVVGAMRPRSYGE